MGTTAPVSHMLSCDYCGHWTAPTAAWKLPPGTARHELPPKRLLRGPPPRGDRATVCPRCHEAWFAAATADDD